MALVTIGVPVYNGAKQIAECLDCLTQQTLRDIEIIVSDNASHDETGQIVLDYAARDTRIRYIRQPTNIGLMKNFKAVVDAAKSPYFVLRCHDDLSSLNYTHALLDALQANAGKHLAVANVETIRLGRSPRLHAAPSLAHPLRLLNIADLLFRSHAAWFCGLWELAALKPVFDQVWKSYDSPWGPDHLTLYPFLISEDVVLVPGATFIQRITRKEGDAAYAKPDIQLMKKLRHTFANVCRDFRRAQGISGAEDFALSAMTWIYTGKRVYKARDIVKYSLLGISRV